MEKELQQNDSHQANTSSEKPILGKARFLLQNCAMLLFRPLFMTLVALGLVSCQISSTGIGRSTYGDRAGPKGFNTVVIDAGHGGKDSGAISRWTGQKEKDLTLDMVKRIKSELGGSFKTILMRSGDEFIDLDERVNRANKHGDAILISVHFNSGPQQIRGPETYFWRVDSHGLATRLQNAMAATSPDERSCRSAAATTARR